MRKRTFIEIIQSVINGGNTTPDVKRKAHPAVVGTHIGNALSEIVFGDRDDLTGELAINYPDLTISHTDDFSEYYTTLPVRPMAGELSITLAVDNIGRAITIRNAMNNFNLDFISPNQHNITATVRNKKLVYGSKPTTPNGQDITSVSLNIIGEFMELSDNDYIVIPGAENTVIRAVLQLMGYSNQIPEDVLNNLKVDRETKQ